MTCPGRSNPRGVCGIRGLRDHGQQPGKDRDPDRDVDQERPPPRQLRRQQTPQERPYRGHAADRRAPNRECDRPLTAAEQTVHRGQRRGQDHRPADPLQKTPKDQDSAARRGCRNEACRHEPDRPDRKQKPPAEHVTEPSEGDQQRGEHKRVDRVHPLRRHRGRVQVPDNRRHRDIDDRGIDNDHRHAQRDERHRQPAPAVPADRTFSSRDGIHRTDPRKPPCLPRLCHFLRGQRAQPEVAARSASNPPPDGGGMPIARTPWSTTGERLETAAGSRRRRRARRSLAQIAARKTPTRGLMSVATISKRPTPNNSPARVPPPSGKSSPKVSQNSRTLASIPVRSPKGSVAPLLRDPHARCEQGCSQSTCTQRRLHDDNVVGFHALIERHLLETLPAVYDDRSCGDRAVQ